MSKENLKKSSVFFTGIDFSEECSLSQHEDISNPNCRIWDYQRPSVVCELLQRCPTLIVWCATFSTWPVAPSFSDDGTATGDRYRRGLRCFFFPKLVDYPSDIIFQRKKALPHYVLVVRQYLDHKLPNRKMGRDGPVPCSARSPELTHVTSSSEATQKIKFSGSYRRTFLTLEQKLVKLSRLLAWKLFKRCSET